MTAHLPRLFVRIEVEMGEPAGHQFASMAARFFCRARLPHERISHADGSALPPTERPTHDGLI